MSSEQTLKSQPADLVLGFDFGSKRVGLAIGNRMTASCRALDHLVSPKNEEQWRPIDKAIAEWKPDALLVGLPLTEDGERQSMTRKARHFVHQLRQRYSIKVIEVDERYSSHAAEAELKQARQLGAKRRLQKGDSDAMAAAVIVQQWLDQV